MPRYSEQFKRDAVALYENNEDLSLHTASAELGINRSSLYSWLKQGPDPRKVDTSGVSYAALVSVAEFSASKTSGAERLHQECRRRVL